MSDQLKDLLQKSELSEIAPPAGHEDRFMARLQAQKTKGNTGFTWVKLVASVTVFISLGLTIWFLNNPTEKPFTKQKMELNEVSPELKIAEQFLVAELAKKKEKASNIVASDPELKGFIEQLNQLEKEYEKLELELNSNRENEHIIAGMIQNYKLRLELLERLFAKYQAKKRIKQQYS